MSQDAPQRIIVDRDLCESNAICTGFVPQRLSLDDGDVLAVSAEPLTPDLAPAAELAVQACPRSALSLTTSPAS
jgi:ferredoxin